MNLVNLHTGGTPHTVSLKMDGKPLSELSRNAHSGKIWQTIFASMHEKCNENQVNALCVIAGIFRTAFNSLSIIYLILPHTQVVILGIHNDARSTDQ